jgi:hypothetical protein
MVLSTYSSLKSLNHTYKRRASVSKRQDKTLSRGMKDPIRPELQLDIIRLFLLNMSLSFNTFKTLLQTTPKFNFDENFKPE